MNEKDFIKSVGREIAKQIKIAGMTQSAVAAKLNLEKESISRIETGVISPTLARLHQLAEIFGCQIRHFFGHEEGTAQEQAQTIAEMLETLPAQRRVKLVRCVAGLVECVIHRHRFNFLS